MENVVLILVNKGFFPVRSKKYNIEKILSSSGPGQVRVRLGSGESQVKVRKVRYLDLSNTLFLVLHIDTCSLHIDTSSHTNF